MKSEDTQIESGSFADVAGACLCRLKYAAHAPDPKDSWYLLFKGLHKLEKGEFKDEWEKHPVSPPHPASSPSFAFARAGALTLFMHNNR